MNPHENEFHPINVFAFRTAIQSSLNSILNSVYLLLSFISIIDA